MLRFPNARRPGLSLTEVLVTLFVVATGLISLMTLFPVGAMNMAQALKDDRIRQTANQGDGIVRIWWQTQVVEQPGNEDPFWKAMDNSNDPAAPLAIQPARALDGNPSYAVFLDPIGWQARSPGQREWIAPPSAAGNLPRRSARPLFPTPPPTMTTLTAAARTCSLMDDITFFQSGPKVGQPDNVSGGSPVVREGGYNWCAVIQRPVNSNRYVADLKICVFHTKGLYGGHIPGLNQGGAELMFSGAQIVSANAGNTRVELNSPISPAALGLRTGSWILDGSNALVANFYRIQSITDNGAGGTYLELDTPLKPGPNNQPITQIYVIRGLAAVFDRPQLTGSGYQRQAP